VKVTFHRRPQAWGAAHGAAGRVQLLADGNGELTRALGLLCDLSVKGMGLRGKRAAMVVEPDLTVSWLVIDTLCDFSATKVDRVLEDVLRLTDADSVLRAQQQQQQQQQQQK
jgi:peroxiredoxin